MSADFSSHRQAGQSSSSMWTSNLNRRAIQYLFRGLLLNLVHWLVSVALSLSYYLSSITWTTRTCHKLKKVPVHLAISLDDPGGDGGGGLTARLSVDQSLRITVTDIANIIAHCIQIGIPYVTLYDHKGVLKRQADELELCVDDRLFKIFGHSRPRAKCKIVRVTSDEESTQNNNLKQLTVLSEVEKSKEDIVVQVQLLSCRDGRQDLVAAVRCLVEMKNRIKSLVTADFAEHIQSNRGLPTPDVLVCCGDAFSTIGFLPWHINLTEIFYLSTHRKITYDALCDILARYEKCEQRLGK